MNFIALAFYAIFLKAGMWCSEWISRTTHAKYDDITSAGLNQIEQIIRKLDYLYSTISGAIFVSAMSVILLYLGGTLIISYVSASFITDNISPPRPSFVLLTRSAAYAKDVALQEYEKNWTVFFGAVIFAILTGVAGNIVTWMVWG
jgi:hypothetical protein